MHELSFGTWWIHIASVIEWILAIVLIQRRGLNGLALAMLPALVSAMAACTWHLFDNSEALRGLVLLQASLTLLGNVALALAALQLKRRAAT
jgi:O-antigen/teichoic acid export membrane protein|tara:strand:+ start:270 stop:545 length:276 start_codon:yes stop_codon:yes gene_type:complete